ncbi:MAG: N-acetylmuramoyl-L-alanine amidase [FCB group bacterium]|jgi:N-acetylmuramoyl-L-alanine amidase|nr:N-acetylmuramoyl-L-alanine amidase [FCB group bacterium]
MKIAIDPGHGMSNRRKGIYDPGATHTENGVPYEEAAIALQYALALKDILRARNHEVFLTRDDPSDHAPVGERAKNAKNAGAQLFLSLHLNDCENDAANGLEVLYRDSAHKPLAQALQTALLKVTGFKDRKIKPRTDLAVLKFDGPAVLIELGFIANGANRETLLNPQKRQAICETIADVAVKHCPG